MGNYDSAFAFVIKLEDDPRHPGSTTHDADGATRYGLLDRWHPDLVAQGFYTTDASSALAIAKAYYKPNYWDKVSGDSISSNKVAAQLFSIGVNDGIPRATRIAQAAANIDPIHQDGVFGPGTLAAVNAVDEATFLSRFDSAAKAVYAHIVAAHPEKANQLQGWYNRVDLINTYQG